MVRKAWWRGVIAGAVGTCALNAAAYLDMALTRRDPSAVPRLAARAIAKRIGFEPAASDDPATVNRWEGFGEALGFFHGLAQGGGYGLVRAEVLPGPPWVAGAFALMLETFVIGEGAAVALGATDPRTWGVAGTLRGLVLRLFFGLATAYTFEALSRDDDPGVKR